jgi:hypothetical protein
MEIGVASKKVLALGSSGKRGETLAVLQKPLNHRLSVKYTNRRVHSQFRIV